MVFFICLFEKTVLSFPNTLNSHHTYCPYSIENFLKKIPQQALHRLPVTARYLGFVSWKLTKSWAILYYWSPVQNVTHQAASLHKGSAHYSVVIMGSIASQITSLTIVYSAVNSGADQRKHQSSASLAFVWGIHRGPVNSLHKGPVMRKMFPFDDVIMNAKLWYFLSLPWLIDSWKIWFKFQMINFQSNFDNQRLRYILWNCALMWFSLDITYDKSALVQIMARCHQTTRYYLNQCWLIYDAILCN